MNIKVQLILNKIMYPGSNMDTVEADPDIEESFGRYTFKKNMGGAFVNKSLYIRFSAYINGTHH